MNPSDLHATGTLPNIPTKLRFSRAPTDGRLQSIHKYSGHPGSGVPFIRALGTSMTTPWMFTSR